jgi:hypothetical protein
MVLLSSRTEPTEKAMKSSPKKDNFDNFQSQASAQENGESSKQNSKALICLNAPPADYFEELEPQHGQLLRYFTDFLTYGEHGERNEPDVLPGKYGATQYLEMAKDSAASLKSHFEGHAEQPKVYSILTARDRLLLEQHFLQYFKNISHISNSEENQRKEGQRPKHRPKHHQSKTALSFLWPFMYLLGAIFATLTIGTTRGLLEEGGKWLAKTQRYKKKQKPYKRKKQGGHSRPWSRNKYRHHHSKP